MQEFLKDNYKKQKKIFGALANENRLWIIKRLKEEEVCVCELVEGLGLDFSTVSKHLTVLKNAGIIIDDKRGKHVFYYLKMPCILNFIRCTEEIVKKERK